MNKTLITNFFLYFLSLISCLFFFKCAKVIHPTGGPKDESKPILVSSSPNNGQICFANDRISLTFDKKVFIKNQAAIVITPNISSEDGGLGFQILEYGNEIVLKFTKPLNPDTTYTINFGESIVDTTENNAAENISLSFSTGNHIDMGAISGIVNNLMTKKVVAGAFVALYRYSDDNTYPFSEHLIGSKILPDYYAVTNKDGEYSLHHIKKGRYIIVAHLSQKKSKILDFGNDAYGFLADIDIDDDNPLSHPISINYSDISDLQIIKSEPLGRHFEITFNKPICHFYMPLPDDLQSRACLVLNKNKKSIIVFCNDNAGSSAQISSDVVCTAFDSVGNKVEHNVNIFLNSTDSKKINLAVELNLANNSSITLAGQIKIISNKPINPFSIKPYKIKLFINDRNTEISLDESSITLSENNTVVNVEYDLSQIGINAENQNNLIIFVDNAFFEDIDRESNSQLISLHPIVYPQQLFNIEGFITTNFDKFTIQLVDQQNNVLKELCSDQIKNNFYTLSNINPKGLQNCFIRVLPENKLYKCWFSGDIRKKISADNVFILDREIYGTEGWCEKIPLSF